MTAFQLQRILERAGRIVSSARGREVSLEPCSNPRHSVFRCTVVERKRRARIAPEAVVVKRVGSLAEFDRDDRDPQGVSARFFDEWAALRFLDEILPPEENPAPRLLGADVDLPCLVLEDRPGENLQTLLLSGDRERAREALLAFARALARVQVAARGEEERYRRIRRELGPVARPRERTLLTGSWFRKNLEQVDENLRVLGVPVTAALLDELESVATALDRPGPFLTFLHGDPTASNFLFSPRLRTLLDFEFAGVAFGPCDATAARMLFPTSAVVNRLPDDVVEEFEAAFWEELSEASPTLDRADFDRALLDACAYWLGIRLAGSLRQPHGRPDRRCALDQDRQWEISSIRQIVLARLEAFAKAAMRFDGLPTVRELSERLASELERRWSPIPPMPFFPAF